MTNDQTEPADKAEHDVRGLIAAFSRLPAEMRGYLIEQAKLIAGMSQGEKAYAVTQLGNVKRELFKSGEVGLTVAGILDHVGRLILAGHHAGAGRDLLAKIQDPKGPYRSGNRWGVSWSDERTAAEVIAAKLLSEPELARDVQQRLQADKVDSSEG